MTGIFLVSGFYCGTPSDFGGRHFSSPTPQDFSASMSYEFSETWFPFIFRSDWLSFIQEALCEILRVSGDWEIFRNCSLPHGNGSQLPLGSFTRFDLVGDSQVWPGNSHNFTRVATYLPQVSQRLGLVPLTLAIPALPVLPPRDTGLGLDAYGGLGQTGSGRTGFYFTVLALLGMGNLLIWWVRQFLSSRCLPTWVARLIGSSTQPLLETEVRNGHLWG